MTEQPVGDPGCLQMLAFEAELARLPRGLIAALWEAIDTVRPHITDLRPSQR